MKIDFSKPLETVLGEPVKHICSDVVEYKSARICVDENGIVYSSPYIGIQIRNVKQEWTGEGLPPVGTVCEYLGAHQYDQWSKVTIFAEWKDLVFVDFGDGWRQERDSSRFRPIRTPEQIAAEERSIAVSEIVHAVGWPAGTIGATEAAERIYDAGYRKQVTP
jgi:hypothetical protein